MEISKQFIENWFNTRLGGYGQNSQQSFAGPSGFHDVLSSYGNGVVLLPGEVRIVLTTSTLCQRFLGSNLAIEKQFPVDLMMTEFTDFSQNAQRTEKLDLFLGEVGSSQVLAADGVRINSARYNLDIYWSGIGLYAPCTSSYMRFKEHISNTRAPRKLVTPKRRK